MSESRDVYFRAHTVVDGMEQKAASNFVFTGLRWPRYAVMFHCDTRRDTSQQLIFGFYRVMELKQGKYVLIEDGGFFDDDLPITERTILEGFMREEVPDVTSFPPRFPLYSRTEFINRVFYYYARKGALIVGFNLSYHMSRLALKWTEGDDSEWSLILSENPDGTENVFHPRVLIEPLDSKKSFFRFRAEWIPKDSNVHKTDIDQSRFVDLRTLVWALFNKAVSLKQACALDGLKKYDIPMKLDHQASGRVTVPDIKDVRQSVRCMAKLLNALRAEYELHPIGPGPERAYSPASMAKYYLNAMGIVPPALKFDVSNQVLGIAMESYTGGRSETRVRHVEVPVVPLDFMSEYPTGCALMELMDILTAKDLGVEDATGEVQTLLNEITFDKAFDRRLWPEFRFFARIKPTEDLLPIRTMYNKVTQNIGNNYFTSHASIWVAGPDLINCVIQTGRVPRVDKAIRLVSRGKQNDMYATHLRGTVQVDPYADDLFRKIIEERKRCENDKDLHFWLKVLANSIYGFFAEINPEETSEREAVNVRVYSGDESFVPAKRFRVYEKQGTWYAPYLASLITSSGRLLLGLLEKSIEDAGGVYAWADTDSLAVVSSVNGGSLAHIPGCQDKRAMSWEEVEEIRGKFSSLNPYGFSGTILNLTKDNFVDNDREKPRRQLLGFSISAKRYVIYNRIGDEITILNPKAHGLGYLYPPFDSPLGWDDEHDAPKWIHDFWECLLRNALGLKPKNPAWLKRPLMMRMAGTSQDVLRRFRGLEGFRPYNSFFVPVLAPGGYPANVNPEAFTPVSRFESCQRKWPELEFVNIADQTGEAKTYKLITKFDHRYYGERIVVDTFENLLHRYMRHVEAKSLAPDGGPCKPSTRGLLRRAHIMAAKHRRIGKETDRHWEEGDDLEALRFSPIEYEHRRSKMRLGEAPASDALIRAIREIGIRELMRQGCARRALYRVFGKKPVKMTLLHEYEQLVRYLGTETMQTRLAFSRTSERPRIGPSSASQRKQWRLRSGQR